MPEPITDTLMALVGQDDVIVVHKSLVQFTGSLEAGMMLGQLLYWTPRASIPEGWIAKSDDDWADELSLTNYAVRKARKALEEMELIETRLARFNGAPTLHYRIRIATLRNKWARFVSQRNSILRNRKNDFAKSQNGLSENEESLTETTTETTAEKLSERGKPLSDTPTSLGEWLQIIGGASNRPAMLRRMHMVLFPSHDPPDYGYVGKAARVVGGAAALAHLLWTISARHPDGDPLAYIIATHNSKNGRHHKDGDNERRSTESAGDTGEAENRTSAIQAAQIAAALAGKR